MTLRMAARNISESQHNFRTSGARDRPGAVTVSKTHFLGMQPEITSKHRIDKTCDAMHDISMLLYGMSLDQELIPWTLA